MDLDEVGGWTLAQREAMLGKLYRFYEAYFQEMYGAPQRDAEDMARKRMETLQYNDIFTMREIFRLLYEASRAADATVKRNLLVSVFNLLLVYDDTDPKSWTLARLHELWKRNF